MQKSTSQLPDIKIPDFVQYIGVFLTLDCNLNCSFCINEPDQSGDRRKYFSQTGTKKRLSPAQWAAGLSRLNSSNDLPITLQGGEPTVYSYPSEKHAFYKIFSNLHTSQKFDLLTNLQFNPEEFVDRMNGNLDLFLRKAPYPSIRVSYHPIEMDRAAKGRGIENIIEKALELKKLGFKISSDKSISDFGVYMVAHQDNLPYEKKARELCYKNGIPFELKEFLGPLEDNAYSGTYKYPFSTNYRGAKNISCECRTSEVLIAPNGYIYRCHHDLYTSASQLLPLPEPDTTFFPEWKDAIKSAKIKYPPVAHILDPELQFEYSFRPCTAYGKCIPCDTKVKNNRFQSLNDKGVAHTSVDIRKVDLPYDLQQKIPLSEVKTFV